MTEQDRKLKGERYGWPENWREIFIKGGENITYTDPDNLFYIAERQYGEIERGYARYNSTTESFVRGCYLNLISGDFISGDSWEPISLGLHTPTDGETFVKFEYRYHSGVVFSKHHVGTRTVSATYTSAGELHDITLILMQPVKPMAPLLRILYDGRINPTSNMNGRVRAVGENMLVERLENGEVKDVIEVPRSVDIGGLKNRFIPDELLNNLRNPDASLDNGWRGVDFFHEAGIRWDAVADDSFHSLTPIPRPASEDQ